MTPNEAHPLIKSIMIRDLFGRRSYDIDIPQIDGKPSRLMLLHGDNGSGKTTLLRLVWHALSAADNRGHRTFIARTPFSRLLINMSGDRSIEITRPSELIGDFELTLSRPGMPDATTFYQSSEDMKVRSPSRSRRLSMYESALLIEREYDRNGAPTRKYREQIINDLTDSEKHAAAERDYLNFLEEEVKTPLYLADDRSLYSDDPDISRMRELLGRREDREDADRADRLARLTFNELQITIQRVNEHLRGLTIGGQNDGSANSNAIYLSILRQLVEGNSKREAAEDTSAVQLLEEVTATSPKFEMYGLVPSLDTDELRRLLGLAQGDLADPANRIVAPFLSTLRARYDALSDAQRLLDSLIPTVNRFLNEKVLKFTPERGLRIVTTEGDALEVESLSSGERQLLMLLCTTILAGIDANLFIIDEPELSLGVAWQRKILGALLGVTERSSLQFLVATHSVEIISGNIDSLVQLKPL